MGRLKDQVRNALAESAEESDPDSAPWLLKRADMYLGDIEQFCSKSFSDANLEVALRVYVVEEKSPGGDVVTLEKKREGVFVLGETRLILSRDISFARTKTADFSNASASCQPIQVLVEGKPHPGFRLRLRDKIPSFAIGLAPPSLDNPAAVQMLRDRVVRALGSNNSA